MLELLLSKVHIYGLLIGIGVWVALEINLFLAKTKEEKIKIEKIFPWILLGGVVGARLYHVVDFWSRYYMANPVKVFYIWEGGLGIWGGIVGGALAVYLYCLVKKQGFLQTMDSLIVGVPLAQAIGRVGNWVNGELIGKNGEPLFAYEALLSLSLFGLLWKYSKKKSEAGKLTGIYLLGYGVARILLEGLRPDDIIWRVGVVPIAVIFGVIAMISGAVLLGSVKKN